MPYTNDMQTLADIVSPAAAASQAGQQNFAANEQEAAKNLVNQATLPAQAQAPYLANLFTAAHTAGEQGVAQQEQAKGAVTNALAPSAIGAGQAENAGKITSAHVGQLQNLGQIVGTLDQQLSQYPDAVKPAVIGQFLDSNGVQDPGIRQLMIGAAGQPGGLQQISQSLFAASDKARETLLAEQTRGGYQLGAAQIGASGRLAQAEANAQARENVARINAQVKQQQQSFEQAAVAAQKRGDMATYQQMSQLAMQMRQAQAQLNSQLLFGQGLPNPAVSGTPVEAPAQQGAQQTSPATEDAVTAEMRKRGLLK